MSSDERASNGGRSSTRRPRHVSPKDKAAAVLRLIRGEDADAVANDVGVSVGRLEQWRATYLAAGLEALEKTTHQKTPYEKFLRNSKRIRPWVGLLLALVITVLLLVRFLNRDTGE